MNFKVEEQSLQHFPYIKLNKINEIDNEIDQGSINSTSKKADKELMKKNNSFLRKANEDLLVEKKKAEEKLEMSKKIIS